MPDPTTTAQTTVDRIALQDVMLDYAAGVDERDLERYTACFAREVEVIGFGNDTFHDRDAWVKYVWQALNQYSATQHLLGPQGATISGDRARTRSDVQALHVLKDGGRFTLWATYLTDMRREQGRWLIYRHELVVRATHSDP